MCARCCRRCRGALRVKFRVSACAEHLAISFTSFTAYAASYATKGFTRYAPRLAEGGHSSPVVPQGGNSAHRISSHACMRRELARAHARAPARMLSMRSRMLSIQRSGACTAGSERAAACRMRSISRRGGALCFKFKAANFKATLCPHRLKPMALLGVCSGPHQALVAHVPASALQVAPPQRAYK